MVLEKMVVDFRMVWVYVIFFNAKGSANWDFGGIWSQHHPMVSWYPSTLTQTLTQAGFGGISLW